MTVAAQTPPLSFDTIEEAVSAVRRGGMRLSTPRRLVLEALFAADGPVSAVHLAHTLSIDESSVYRNLEVLERHGLVRHVHLGHGPGLYVLVCRNDVEYLYCERCAKVTAVPPGELDPLRVMIRERFGYEARFTHFAIVGLCAQCGARSPSSVGDEGRVTGEDLHAHHHDASAEGPRAPDGHAHLHSHGDVIHSHPHAHGAIADQHRH